MGYDATTPFTDSHQSYGTLWDELEREERKYCLTPKRDYCGIHLKRSDKRYHYKCAKMSGMSNICDDRRGIKKE